MVLDNRKYNTRTDMGFGPTFVETQQFLLQLREHFESFLLTTKSDRLQLLGKLVLKTETILQTAEMFCKTYHIPVSTEKTDGQTSKIEALESLKKALLLSFISVMTITEKCLKDTEMIVEKMWKKHTKFLIKHGETERVLTEASILALRKNIRHNVTRLGRKIRKERNLRHANKTKFVLKEKLPVTTRVLRCLKKCVTGVP